MSRRLLIEQALRGAFAPTQLEIEDESHMHSKGKGRESHFRVVVVSAVFADLSRLERHRSVNAAVKSLFASGLHALSIHALTEAEYSRDGGGLASPPCAGVTAK